jgi:hypothetical protein
MMIDGRREFSERHDGILKSAATRNLLSPIGKQFGTISPSLRSA